MPDFAKKKSGKAEPSESVAKQAGKVKHRAALW